MSSISNGAPPASGPGPSATRVASGYAPTLSGASCPGCRSPVDPEGDFCERCRTWLKPGQCRFCYQDLPTDAAFCVECGSPQAGFDCAGCGRHDYFDFCPGCGDPLSEAAAAALQALAEDPAFAPSTGQDAGEGATLKARESASDASRAAGEAADAAFAQTPRAPPPAAVVRRRLFSRGRLDAMDEGGKAAPAPAMRVEAPTERARESGGAPPADLDDTQRQAILADLAARDQAARGVAAAARQPVARVVERSVEQVLEESAQRTFENPQDARRFHMALAQQLARHSLHPKSWRCHRYGCVHRGPHECSAPQFGGVWVST